MDGSNSSSSFWTVCHGCSMQYEYPNFCKYNMVLCAQCRKPFRAIVYPTPSMAHGPLKLEERIKRQSDGKVSSRVFSPTASKVDVKFEPKAEVKVEQPSWRDSCGGGESKQKDQKRKIRKDKGFKRAKFSVPPNMIPPNKLRSALIEKSKSLIKDFTGWR